MPDIVKCKDCQHGSCEPGDENIEWKCDYFDCDFLPDFFCAWGVKRDNS